MYYPVNNSFCQCRGDTIRNQKFLQPKETVNASGDHRELARIEFTTSQPHFIPGYTGYTPGALYNSLGQTYGHYTHKLLNDHRVGGNRLCRIPGDFCFPSQFSQAADVNNPHQTLEPHFIPGYTGFTAGSGVMRAESFGETYGKTTHVNLAKHFLKGSRLRPIHEYPEDYTAREEDVKFYNYEHELTRDDIKRRTRVLPGYTGHIPRARFRNGKSGSQVAEECIAEFQQILNKNKEFTPI